MNLRVGRDINRRLNLHVCLAIALILSCAHNCIVPASTGASASRSGLRGRDELAARMRSEGAATRPGALDIDQYLKEYEIVTLDPAVVAKQAQASGAVCLATRRARFDLLLAPHDLRAPDYRAQVILDGGVAQPVSPDPVRTYAGTVRGVANSQARFTIDREGVEGLIFTGDESYYVEPLGRFSPSAGQTTIVYRGSDVNPDAAATCGATLAERVEEASKSVTSSAPLAGAPTSLVVDLATEADFEYVTASGGAPRLPTRSSAS